MGVAQIKIDEGAVLFPESYRVGQQQLSKACKAALVAKSFPSSIRMSSNGEQRTASPVQSVRE